MRCVGIDLGYGRTKMYAGDRCKANFPSVVSSQVPVHTFGDADQKYHPITAKGVTYIVGDEAELHAMTVEDTRRDNFVGSGSWFALLGNALRMADFDCFRDAITIGLPPGHLSPEKKEEVLREILETSMISTNTGKTYTLEQTRIFVVPQGTGIFFSHVMTNRDVLNQKVVVVDVGHHTIDMIYMASREYVEKQRQTHTFGVGRQLDEILRRSRSRGNKLRYGDLVSRMADGFGLVIPGNTHFIPEAYEVLKGYTRTVMSMIDAYIDSTDGMDLCLIGGGGAIFLLPDSDPDKFFVVANPEMANAIGYWGWANAQTLDQ